MMRPKQNSMDAGRGRRFALTGLALALCVAVSAHAQTQTARAVDSVAITVSDMSKALDFYTNVLPFEIEAESETTGDTEANLRLWHDALGFEVVGESENYGPEQEHLNNVFGARLRITALKAPGGGIGVEFLEYLAPSTGRPTPADTRANDLWHWHVNVATDDAGEAAATARRGGARWVSPGAIAGLDAHLGYTVAALVRDADGHGIVLGQR